MRAITRKGHSEQTNGGREQTNKFRKHNTVPSGFVSEPLTVADSFPFSIWSRWMRGGEREWQRGRAEIRAGREKERIERNGDKRRGDKRENETNDLIFGSLQSGRVFCWWDWELHDRTRVIWRWHCWCVMVILIQCCLVKFAFCIKLYITTCTNTSNSIIKKVYLIIETAPQSDGHKCHEFKSQLKNQVRRREQKHLLYRYTWQQLHHWGGQTLF